MNGVSCKCVSQLHIFTLKFIHTVLSEIVQIWSRDLDLGKIIRIRSGAKPEPQT